MNVGIFNRVNHKNKDSGGMYAEWSSLPLEGGGHGVLGSVGGAAGAGRDVVLAVVRQLTSHEPSPLTTDAEVEWVLEVIRFGLSLPLHEHEALRDCVRVCCSWLSPLLPPVPPAQPPPPAVPPPVAAAPKRYARKILSHLHNLFVPRPNESGDLIGKQAVLCHRVLRLARTVAGSADLGAAEWKSLLLLLLAAARALLSPPAPHHSSADQLCRRVLAVLLEVWLLACHRCFPSPPLWRTLREQCIGWRHRAPLTEQWTRVSLCLTARLLRHMYGPLFPAMPISDEDATLIPPDMSAEAVMQSWYRILHTIGNPVDLCRPHVISQTPDFLQYSVLEEGARDPSQHPCLQALPAIFHNAMRGLAAHVDAFLGRGSERWWEAGVSGAGGGGGAGAEEGDTPPAHRRLAKSYSVAGKARDKNEKGTPRSSLIGLTGGGRPVSVAPTTPPNSIVSQVCESEKLPLTPLRPKVNSIFHLFGEWLFEAALIGTTPSYNNQRLYTDMTIFGPDSLYYTFCSFVQAHFLSLKYDIESIITPSSSLRLQTTNDAYESKFRACVGRHRELIRCCDLIEAVFSKSALFNFMSSSLLLCMAGFNIVAYDDLGQFSNFLSFLFICLTQIYLICDYGDKLSLASMDLSSAVYNCQWYNVDPKSARDLLMILTRAQNPCKLTAYGFAEINLGAFSRILSTSWSYFALLQSVYSRDNGH